MSESVRRLKANRVMEGKTCAACGRAVSFGDDVAVCAACGAVHDASCWDGRGGCATPTCVNAPLERLPEKPAPERPAVPPVGKIECPHCGKWIRSRSSLCPHCGQVPTPDGVYHGPTQNAPGAVASMVWGIVGLLICGVILGIVAIVNANRARKLVDSDPRYTGRGYATAGLVLGILDLVIWGMWLLWYFGQRGRGF